MFDLLGRVDWGKFMFFFIWPETTTLKRFEEYETNTDQLNNLGFGGVSSTCPTTKVILPHRRGKMANTGCLIVKINSNYPFVCKLIIITLNDSAYICMFELCLF